MEMDEENNEQNCQFDRHVFFSGIRWISVVRAVVFIDENSYKFEERPTYF